MGTTLDVTDRLLKPWRREGRRVYDGRRAKYYLLALLLLLALLGVQWAGLFDPLSVATRTYGLAVQPWATRGIDETLRVGAALPVVGRAAENVRVGLAGALDAHPPPTYRQHGVILLVFVVVVLLGLLRTRYWCRNLCPLGAMLGLFSLRNLLRRKVSDECTSCGRCPPLCPMGAIPPDRPTHTLAGECILCMNCRDVCPHGAVAFGPRQPAEQSEEVDLSRRAVLAAAATAVVLAPATRVISSAGLGSGRPSLIRPPGALPEVDFLAACIRCGECMRVCPTNGLQPVGFERGLDGLWSPRLVPRIGPCDYRCNACTRVCPTGALRPLDLADKQRRAIGLARVDRSRCIPWVGSQAYAKDGGGAADCNCGVCEEFCPVPTKAIRFNSVHVPGIGEVRRPFIVESLCVGCGTCEHVCPVPGQAAIRVEGRQLLLDQQGSAALGDLFPLSLAGLQRMESPHLYEGSEGLWNYIDGGADPYLTYAFLRAGTCQYGAGGQARVKLDIWQFGNTADAFGVHNLDRAVDAQPLDVGDAAAATADSLWMWQDKYAVWLRAAAGRAALKDGREMAKQVSAMLPPTGARRPALVSRLPASQQAPLSALYFHSARAMTLAAQNRDLYLAEKAIPDILGASVSGVMAQYEVSGGKKAWLVLAGPDGASLAARFAEMRRNWGQPEETADGITIFAESDGFFAAQLVSDALLIAALRCPSRADALALVRRATRQVR